jgi:DUF1016 N-terminal domain
MGEVRPRKILVLYQQIREVLTQAVNYEMVACYWEIGRLIVEEEQRGEARADYGARIIVDISKRLTAEFGKGFDRTNLQYMRAFFLNFPIRDAVRRELSWTHYRLLLRVEKPDARSFYEKELASELLGERRAIEMEAVLAGKTRKTRNRKEET